MYYTLFYMINVQCTLYNMIQHTIVNFVYGKLHIVVEKSKQTNKTLSLNETTVDFGPYQKW